MGYRPLRTVTKTYKDGELIYRQGEDSQWAFEVLEGSVELVKNGPEGATVMARLKAGELFGELGILDNTPRSTAARARGAVTVKAIPRDEFLRQVEADPDTALKVMTKLARRMRSPEGGDPVRAAAYKAAASNLPVLVRGTDILPPPEATLLRTYTANVYCCNCEPAYHFDVAIPRGVIADGCFVTCPNCEVAGRINHYHQVWPLIRRRGR